jgi:hypothetical protein
LRIELKRGEMTECWRKLHDTELHNLYSSPNILRMIKARKMKLVGHAALMGEMRNEYKICLQSLKGRDHSEHLDVDGKMILKWILGQQGGNCEPCILAH